MSGGACEICGAVVQTFKRACDGDGRVHHHGLVHTRLRGESNDLALVGVECGCADRDRASWAKWPTEQSERP